MVGKRKTPERKCVITNEMKAKKDLIRIVRDKEGEVSVDPTGKKNGRGAYLTKDLAVINQAEKTGVLAKHLNAEIDHEVYEELRTLVQDRHEK
ncbi:RNase P modulator RnpM [Paucisalibacillus sp. EB02]|uniref:RNase P modulator RnpM n=1 Tax=Paucisalibacillus sp. EB02 TaxID=1347087 RepID=UPI0004BA8C18|nr:YlxR family protein [Paucisalibacillus sp. EB02]